MIEMELAWLILGVVVAGAFVVFLVLVASHLVLDIRTFRARFPKKHRKSKQDA